MLKDKACLPSSSVSAPTLHIVDGRSSSSLNVAEVEERSANEPSSMSLSTFSSLRCESLLRWPVFDGLVSDEEKQVVSFVLESARHVDKDRPSVTGPKANGTEAFVRSARLGDSRPSKGGRGVEEEDFVALCRKFLIHVHPRNPILEADQLIKHARKASEEGLSWDSASCLAVSPLFLRSLHDADRGRLKATCLRFSMLYESVGDRDKV